MNELVFGKIMIPEKGKSASFNLAEWGQVRKVAEEAARLLAESSPTRYKSDRQALEFVCRQYMFLADSRQHLFEAAEDYLSAIAVQSEDRDQALEYMEKARGLVAEQASSFEDLTRQFKVLWNLENRPHWYDVGTAVYTRRNKVADHLSLLDQAISRYSSGGSIPQPGDVRMDINQHDGQYFQYWLLCGSFPLSDPGEAGMDFLRIWVESPEQNLSRACVLQMPEGSRMAGTNMIHRLPTGWNLTLYSLIRIWLLPTLTVRSMLPQIK